MKAVCFFSLIGFAAGARILALLPFAAKSHHIFFQAVLKTLSHRGHHVVVYSPFPLERPEPNYVDVYINTSFTESFVTYGLVMELLKASGIANTKKIWKEMDRFTEDTFRHENIQKLIASDEKFDVVVTEAFFGQEALLGFGHKFSAPTIVLHPLGCFGFVNRVLGNSLALSYIPDSSLPFSDQMTLYERAINSYSILSTTISFYREHIPRQQQILDSYMKMSSAPSLSDMVENVSLVMTNAHPTIHYPQPMTPNIVPLGGIHVATERKPLPENIQKFMDSGEHGVIYFSLGTVVPDNQMPEKYFGNFLTVFKRLPQRVLWKTRRENISEIPSNVMIVNWAPQQDVLAHPNCVLFMTHGGLLSLLETVFAGVPVVGIPFFNDQHMNVHYYEQKNIGVKLDFLNLSEETILNAIETVMNNTLYKENIRKLSAIFKGLPMFQYDSASFWVDYVLRHGGAHHLRPASAAMPWHQLILLDILVAFFGALLLSIVFLYVIFRMVISFIRTGRNNNHLVKKRM